MDLVHHLLVLLHLLGMAAVVGSAVFVARGRATPALVWGARAQVVTGLLLVGVLEAGEDPVNHAKVGVKLVVALAVAACAEIAAGKARRGEGERPRLVTAAGVLRAAEHRRRGALDLRILTARLRRAQGRSSSLPWVRRPSRSSYAWAASASG